MEITKVSSVVFSATGSTKSIVRRLCRALGDGGEEFDITRSNACVSRAFSAGELVVFGVPAYGGRVPVPARAKISACEGNGALAVLAASFGNRDIDDTLVELADLVSAAGFQVVSAAAFVAKHSLFGRVAEGRPDADDLSEVDAFARRSLEKITEASSADEIAFPEIPGIRPYCEFSGVPFVPEVVGACTMCARCSVECPVGAIPVDDPRLTDASKCISCMRCVALCPLKGRAISGLKYKAASVAFAAKCAKRQRSRIYL